MARIHFGMQIPNTIEPYARIRELAVAADNGRWRTVWNYDHLYPPFPAVLPQLDDDRGEDVACFEAWSMLGALAESTRRVRIGCMVSANTLRSPALVAKMATTVDHISNGRLIVGIGAGWHEGQHKAFGLTLPPLKERMDRLEEATALLRAALHIGGRVTLDGPHYPLNNAPFYPPPVQPKIPILVGGSGEKRTLRIVARYGDACNVWGNLVTTRDDVAKKLGVLERHCEAEKRDPKKIWKTVSLFLNLVDDPAEAKLRRDYIGRHLPEAARDKLVPVGTAQRLIDEVAPYVALGVDEICVLGLPMDVATFERFDREVIAAFD